VAPLGRAGQSQAPLSCAAQGHHTSQVASARTLGSRTQALQCSQQEVRLRRELEQPRGGGAAKEQAPGPGPRRRQTGAEVPAALGPPARAAARTEGGARQSRRSAAAPSTEARFIGCGLAHGAGAGQDSKDRWKQPRSTAPAARQQRYGGRANAGAPAEYRRRLWSGTVRALRGPARGFQVSHPTAHVATLLPNPSLKRRPSAACRLARQAAGQCRPVGPCGKPLRAP